MCLSSVDAVASRRESDVPLGQVLFPGVEVIDQQREMIAAIVRDDFAVAPADQMQLLIDA